MQHTIDTTGQAAVDTPDTRLMLVDSNDYTASVLIEDLRHRGLGYIHWAASTPDLHQVLEANQPDVVVINYHSDQPNNLMVCSTIKLLAPKAATVVISSPGPALKAVRHWAKQTSSIDVIIEKPLSDERFFAIVLDLLRVKAAAREADERVARLTSLVSDEAMAAVDHPFKDEAEIFEAVVLFTDIRGSSQLIRDTPPQVFFECLNDLLSAQAAEVRKHQGAVIKYTGDGMMAVFRGMGRSYLALRCGLALAALHGKHPFPFGIGIAQGLVLAGFIGDSAHAGQKRQYDVIGATVHMAARLCELAKGGEVVATKALNKSARVTTPVPRLIAGVSLRGFAGDTDCLAFVPDTIHSIVPDIASNINPDNPHPKPQEPRP